MTPTVSIILADISNPMVRSSAAVAPHHPGGNEGSDVLSKKSFACMAVSLAMHMPYSGQTIFRKLLELLHRK